MAGDSSNTGRARNYFGSYGNGAISFINIYDASTIVTNVNDGSILGTGAWRAAIPSDFAANISLSGVSITVGSVAITGNPNVSVSNPQTFVGITGTANIAGSVNAKITGDNTINVQVTGSPIVTPIYQGTSTVSNSTPSGVNGLALSANATRKSWFVQNNSTGNALFIGFGTQSSTQTYNFILKGASTTPNVGDGASFIDTFGQWKGSVFVSGQAPNYIIWELP